MPVLVGHKVTVAEAPAGKPLAFSTNSPFDLCVQISFVPPLPV